MSREVRKSRDQLIDALHSAVRAQQRAVDLFDQAVVDRFGLNRTDGRVIDLLQEFGPMTAGDVARAAHLSTGAVTTVIDRLVERGMVRRMDDPGDRRRVIVGITAKTDHACTEIYGPVHDDGMAIIERFTDAELAAIIEFLELGEAMHERHTAALAALPPMSKPRQRASRD